MSLFSPLLYISGPNVPQTDPACDDADLDDDGDVDLADFALMQTALLGSGLPSGSPNIVYDYRDQMVEYTDAGTSQRHVYQYDGLGRRIARTTDADGTPTTTYYFYHGQQVIEEQDTTSTQATYVYGNYIDEVLTMHRGITDYYYHTDDLYNVMAVTNGAGTVVERYEYADYGQPTIYDANYTPRTTSTIGNPLLFNSRRYDPETSLYWYRTRYQDPETGRFTSRDTIGIWGDPNNLGNGLAYVGNNPWTAIDPFGLQMSVAGGGRHHMARDTQMTRVEAAREAVWQAHTEAVRARANVRLLNLVADWGSSAAPGVNDGRDILGMWRGVDPVTEESLSYLDRGLYLGGVALGSGPWFKKAKDAVAAGCSKLWGKIKTGFRNRRTTKRLQKHVDSAVAEVDELGDKALTFRQREAAKNHPELRPAYRGNRIDVRARESVRQDPALRHLESNYNRGPDFVDPNTGAKWDMTTSKQWQGHVNKYGTDLRHLPTDR